MQRRLLNFLWLLFLLTACGLIEDLPFNPKRHSVSFANETGHDLLITFLADSRVGGTEPRFESKDSTFWLANGESFEMISDDYRAGGTEPAYVNYHTLEEISDRIHYFIVQARLGGDTLSVRTDLVNEARWELYDNDPISFGSASHYYTYEIIESDIDD